MRDSGFPDCVKTPKIQNRPKNYTTGMANIRHSRAELAPGWNRGGNPAQIERGTRTLQSRTARPSLKGARSARFIRWIPACAGMARGGMETAE